jgi:hypothetical protein
LPSKAIAALRTAFASLLPQPLELRWRPGRVVAIDRFADVFDVGRFEDGASLCFGNSDADRCDARQNRAVGRRPRHADERKEQCTMTYLSEFEVLSHYIVPPALLPPGASVPFRFTGYFVALARLVDDAVAGDLRIRLRFAPSAPFPAATKIIVDEQTAGASTSVLALDAQNEVDLVIPPRKTILVGIAPNVSTATVTGPLAAPFGIRGYVTLRTIPPSATSVYRIGVLPEHRPPCSSGQATATGSLRRIPACSCAFSEPPSPMSGPHRARCA